MKIQFNSIIYVVYFTFLHNAKAEKNDTVVIPDNPSSETTCPTDYYGDSCHKTCSDGCPDHCKENTGECNQSGDFKCNKGYESSSTSTPEKQDCAVPTCFGKAGCSNGGDCIAPNYCICGKAGAQVIGKKATYKIGEETYEGTDCISLRKNGMLGALVALFILCCAITTCGMGAKYNNKKTKKGTEFPFWLYLGGAVTFFICCFLFVWWFGSKFF